MKTITKLSFIAVIGTIIATSGAFADNQRLENRLIRQQHANLVAESKTPTIALGGTAPKVRFEMRTNAHGQTTGSYVPVD